MFGPHMYMTFVLSMVQLHSTVGGIASRPILPDSPKLIELVRDYASLLNQCYPHYVRLETPFLEKDSPLE